MRTPFHYLPLAALLLASPALAAPGTHDGHNHAPGESCGGHKHAAEPHDHAAEKPCDEHGHNHADDAHEGHKHAAEQHDHAAEKPCDGHGHNHADDAHASHPASVPCSGDDHDHDSGMPEAIIVTADPHSRHLIALQVELVPEPTGALSSSLYGTLSSPEHALHTYAMPVGGHITLHVKSAQKVQEGDILYSIESPSYTDQEAAVREGETALARCEEEVATLRARIDRLKAVETRNSDLEDQLNFKQAEARQLTRDLDMKTRRLRMLARGAESMKGDDGLSYLAVKARKAGTVRNVGVLQGSWCEQGAPVITISDPNELEIRASLYANDLPTFTRVRAHVPQGGENLAVEGSWRLAEQVDPQTQTRALYFAPDTLPAGARPGQLCRLDLYDDAAACGNAIPIPDSAIVRVGMDDMVFVELEAGRYAALKVHAGDSRRGMTPVSGLKPGQRIVVKGGYELKYILPGDGQQKKAGHFHADGKFHEGEH